MCLSVLIPVKFSSVYSQPFNYSCGADNQQQADDFSKSLSCFKPASADYVTKYSQTGFYLPNGTDEVKTIRLRFVILQRESPNDPSNFQNNTQHLQYFKDLIDEMNRIYENIQASSPCNLSVSNPDSKIRVVLDGLTFKQNEFDWNNNNYSDYCPDYIKNVPNNYISKYAQNKDKALNIFMVVNSTLYNHKFNGGALSFPCNSSLTDEVRKCAYFGCATFPTFDIESVSSFIVDHNTYTTYKEVQNNGWSYEWSYKGKAGNLVHEIGHNLHLYHQTDCNNIMHPNFVGSFFSDEQISNCHKSLSLESIRKYVIDQGVVNSPIAITSNETWEFDFRSYSNITVATNTTLTLKCRLSMPHKGQINVMPGGKLIIDGGIVTNEYGGNWGGIIVNGDPSKPMAMGGNADHGYVELKNGAKIENALVGIDAQYGGVINASNSDFYNNIVSIRAANFPGISSMGWNGTTYYPLSGISMVKNCRFIFEQATNYAPEEKIKEDYMQHKKENLNNNLLS